MEYQGKQTYLLNNINSVLKIQSNIRRFNINKNIKLRGVAYINRNLCNNDEDFYTYESIKDIENKYGEYNLSSNGKIISRFDFVKTYYDSLSYIKKNTPKILPIPTSAFNNIAIRPMYTALDFSKFD